MAAFRVLLKTTEMYCCQKVASVVEEMQFS
jgi:hypothetical protein